MTCRPNFIGVYTSAMPAKVNNGLAWSHPPPVQFGSMAPTIDPFEWRTATPLGRPVVPEV